jgi:hypothetical protein
MRNFLPNVSKASVVRWTRGAIVTHNLVLVGIYVYRALGWTTEVWSTLGIFTAICVGLTLAWSVSRGLVVLIAVPASWFLSLTFFLVAGAVWLALLLAPEAVQVMPVIFALIWGLGGGAYTFWLCLLVVRLRRR